MYRFETDSKQVPWGKDEKDFEKRVKSAWNCWKGSDLNQPLRARLLSVKVMSCCVSVSHAVGRKLSALGVSCFRCQQEFMSMEDSKDMGANFRVSECVWRNHLLIIVCCVCFLLCSCPYLLDQRSSYWHHLWWPNGSSRPVLKHGPRSLSWKFSLYLVDRDKKPAIPLCTYS